MTRMKDRPKVLPTDGMKRWVYPPAEAQITLPGETAKIKGSVSKSGTIYVGGPGDTMRHRAAEKERRRLEQRHDPEVSGFQKGEQIMNEKVFATKGVPSFQDGTVLTKNEDGSLSATKTEEIPGTTVVVSTSVNIPETADNFATCVEETDAAPAADSTPPETVQQ